MQTAAAEPFGLFRDRAVHLPEADALVVADLHLGKADAPAVDVPLDEGPAIVDRLGKLVDQFEPATVVLGGDVLHAFDAIPRTARDALVSLADRVSAAGASLAVLEGNHDVQLGPLIDVEPAQFRELADGTVVCHGHERPSATGRRYVIGHDHPVIEIHGRRRPCALYGPDTDTGADVLALPAFSPAVRGSAVNRWAPGDPLSPFLADISQFRPVVWDNRAEETLVFPALGSLQTYL